MPSPNSTRIQPAPRRAYKTPTLIRLAGACFRAAPATPTRAGAARKTGAGNPYEKRSCPCDLLQMHTLHVASNIHTRSTRPPCPILMPHDTQPERPSLGLVWQIRSPPTVGCGHPASHLASGIPEHQGVFCMAAYHNVFMRKYPSNGAAECPCGRRPSALFLPGSVLSRRDASAHQGILHKRALLPPGKCCRALPDLTPACDSLASPARAPTTLGMP